MPIQTKNLMKLPVYTSTNRVILLVYLIHVNIDHLSIRQVETWHH